MTAFGTSFDDSLGIRLIGPVAAVCTLIGYAVFARGYRLTGEGRLIEPGAASRG